MTKETYLISTAIPYANGAPHIGHAYERIATDVMARFKRLDGADVLFITGMDEHGQKMQQTAAREGITPIQLADRTAVLFEQMGEDLNAKADDIVRTTQARHREAVQDIWRRMEANGDIYLAKYSGWYSVRDEAYYDEDETEVREERRFSLKTNTLVEWVEEESYFFKLSAYAEPLLKFYDENPDFIVPEQYRNEIVSFVKRGLKDLSISRTTFNWGVPVPDNPKHVMYVWVDALTNYITATGYPDAKAPLAHFWPASAHVIGKDITRFHAIYWPAFLMSAKLPTPKQIVVHGFLFNKGEKMSKSTGNVLSHKDLVDQYGVDQVRYFFMREVPYGNDGSYSQDAIQGRMNADLANDLGNLAQRSLSMINKNCNAVVPVCGSLSDNDKAILAMAQAMLAEVRNQHAAYAISKAMDVIWKVVAEANRYFAGEAPWGLKKTDPAKMETVLYVTAEVLRRVGLLVQPYVPQSAAKLLDALAVPQEERSFASFDTALKSGTPLPAPQPIFPRYVEPEAKA
ncbi:methionine--tRNA ligase [Aestuariivirga litoralis]|uniref:methionine--tRNA ligase n=1 Tax=Aestuariivirga litoralis TaxID=2650924 RepID=UPI0018C7D113|nr:methionine--tRNA ligase [Aestuariivirga litoralis]MBG1231581.1 methionine--tRNA ligase [Aestuariivirga litoralis]